MESQPTEVRILGKLHVWVNQPMLMVNLIGGMGDKEDHYRQIDAAFRALFQHNTLKAETPALVTT